jgi:hypothetical protein
MIFNLSALRYRSTSIWGKLFIKRCFDIEVHNFDIEVHTFRYQSTSILIPDIEGSCKLRYRRNFDIDALCKMQSAVPPDLCPELWGGHSSGELLLLHPCEAMPHTNPLQHSRLPASPTYSAQLFLIATGLLYANQAVPRRGDERSVSHPTARAVDEGKRVGWQKQPYQRPAQGPLSTQNLTEFRQNLDRV